MMTGEHFKPVQKGKLSAIIVKSVRDSVLSGKLGPGDKLPSEQEMSERFSVSRQTIREALRVLEMQGIIAIRNGIGGGAFVAKVSVDVAWQSMTNYLHQQSMTLRHLFETRKLLEPYFIRNAVSGMAAEDHAALASALEMQKDSLAKRDVPSLRKAEIQFHRLLALPSQNPLLILIFDFVESLLTDAKIKLNTSRDFSRRVIAQHELIYEAVCARDAESARKYILQDIEIVESCLQDLVRKSDCIEWH
ncbi:MAG: FadR family transcriptional regulator [Desulfovibrionaceae bacterium]|nr:FadR family transcriptional regulator [Desulfovibrionaceae bacterium]